MTRTRLAASTFIVLLMAASGSSRALAQDRQLRPEASDLGVSLERYCVAQLGRTDLSEQDLAECRERLQDDVDEFATLDEGIDPLAHRGDPADDLDFADPDDSFEFDDLDGDTRAGRTGRAAKRDEATGTEFDADEDPVEDDEFGFDFQFEGREEPEDPVEDFDFDPIDDPDAEPLGDLEDAPRPAPAAKPPVAPTGSAAAVPASIQLDVVGKTPLADNYPPMIVATDRDSVVVELPVLLGRSRADFDGVTYCIVAEVYADGHRVAEARQEVTVASLAEFGPSFAFVKMLAPVTAKSGELEIRLSKAPSMTGKGTPLFSRKVAYQLP